jgi:hypothetical protein
MLCFEELLVLSEGGRMLFLESGVLRTIFLSLQLRTWVPGLIVLRYPFLSIKGGIFGFFLFYVQYSTLLHLPPLRFHCVGEDAEIELRTVVTTALAVRRSNHSARSHPQ